MPGDTELAALATVCTQRLTERTQIRELRTEVAPPAPAATWAAPVSPRIGSDSKPLPPDTIRAAFF